MCCVCGFCAEFEGVSYGVTLDGIQCSSAVWCIYVSQPIASISVTAQSSKCGWCVSVGVHCA